MYYIQRRFESNSLGRELDETLTKLKNHQRIYNEKIKEKALQHQNIQTINNLRLNREDLIRT